MGQGLHTKVVQVASQCFGIPSSMIFVSETSSNTVPNGSPTAASMGSDLYGMAVLDACGQILARLKPVRESIQAAKGRTAMAADSGGEGVLSDEQHRVAEWKDLVTTAYYGHRVNLSAQGFYIVPTERVGYDWSRPTDQQTSQTFNYFTQGVCVTEVQVDVLTGDSRVLRADILMDLGKSINPAIDIGQVEGAYVQGFGWSTMEEMIWGDKSHPWVRPGQLFSRGPGTYKIPAFNDVPLDFRVTLAAATENRHAVHSSKAVGEPPFFMGCSAFFAIQVSNVQHC
jgi:xanthine dehydrogenase/oxidase